MNPANRNIIKTIAIFALAALAVIAIMTTLPGETYAAPADKVVTLQNERTDLGPNVQIEAGKSRSYQVAYLNQAYSSDTSVASLKYTASDAGNINGSITITGVKTGLTTLAYGNRSGVLSAIQYLVIDPDNVSAYTLKEGGEMYFSSVPAGPGQRETRPSPVTVTAGQFDRIAWNSMNESVATVAQNGAITSAGKGVTIVTGDFIDKWGVPRYINILVGVGIEPGGGSGYTVASISISPPGDSGAAPYVDAGNTLKFSAEVKGTGTVPQGVTWELSGAKSAGTTIGSDGLLKIAANESVNFIYVRATSVADNTVFKNQYVYVTYKSNLNVEPKGPIELTAGESLQFHAKLSANGADVTEFVKWEALYNQSSGTYVDARGLLHIAADETAGSVDVYAFYPATAPKGSQVSTSERVYVKRPPAGGEARISYNYAGNGETYGLYPGALPCVGKPKVVAFVIDFLNEDPSYYPYTDYSVSDIEKHFFDNSKFGMPFVPWYGRESYSLRDYYYRASYGKLDITGDVIAYTTQKPRNEYKNAASIVQEVMATKGSESALDWSKYDANGDGYIDGVYFILRSTAPFPTPQFVQRENFSRSGKKIIQYAFLISLGMSRNISTLAHETFHLMGLLDMYGGSSSNPGGSGATTIMNGTHGDLPGVTKCVFNWINPQYIDAPGKTQVTLSSLSDQPQCAIIYPKGDKSNLNWFVVEYITNTNNNYFIATKPGGGLRIWRVSMDPRFFENGAYPYLELFRFWDYIEAVNDGKWDQNEGGDYYFYPGDSFTPYTVLNSNYPISFQTVPGNGSGTDKIMQNLKDSGIYIENIQIAGGKANFTVTIKNE